MQMLVNTSLELQASLNCSSTTKDKKNINHLTYLTYLTYLIYLRIAEDQNPVNESCSQQ